MKFILEFKYQIVRAVHKTTLLKEIKKAVKTDQTQKRTSKKAQNKRSAPTMTMDDFYMAYYQKKERYYKRRNAFVYPRL